MGRAGIGVFHGLRDTTYSRGEHDIKRRGRSLTEYSSSG